MESDLKNHWEKVYETKQPHQVSWTQDVPATSLDFLASFELPFSASIIDIGGGDSKFADYLLDIGSTNITVLDISAKAIERAKVRLGERSKRVKWIVSDVLDFKPEVIYDFWHDRAAFHFLTRTEDIVTYLNVVHGAANHIVIGTFSIDGPFKCSGLHVSQYDENSMKNSLKRADL